MSGGLIIYPTDTAYGLGANALDEMAVKKVYDVKGRDFSKPTHVVVTDWKMINQLTFTNKASKLLYEKFLPGLLTIILPKKKIVPDTLTSGFPTIGVRIPNNQVTKALSNHLSFPYTTPSANKSGGKTPYSVEEVAKELELEKIDLILDAGKLPTVLPSTMIDLSVSPPKLFREGQIKKVELEKILGMSIST